MGYVHSARNVYGCISAAIVLVELAIATWVHDAWVRPYGGDVLAVMLVYTLLRATSPLGRWPALALSFASGLVVELAQWGALLARLGLADHAVLRVVAGTVCDPGDVVAYALGAALAALIPDHGRRMELRGGRSLPCHSEE